MFCPVERGCTTRRLLLVALLLPFVFGGGEEEAKPACIDDAEPPIIEGLEISGSEIDVTESAQNLMVALRVSDKGSPVERCSLSLRSSDRLHPQFVVFSGPKECSTDGLSCVLSLTAQIKPHIVAGEWTLEVSCRDTPCSAGGPRNTFTYAGKQLTAMGLPGAVTILSADPDIAPPEVVALEFSPNTVDVSEGEATVTALLLVQDDISGVESCLVTLRSPEAKVRATLDGSAQCSEDRRKCGFTMSAVLPPSAPPGLWTPSVFCRDSVQNRMLVNAPELADQGFTGVDVETEEPDSVPPRLLQFSFAPQTVNVGSAPASVEASMVVLDLETPLADCTLIFHGPQDRQVAVGEPLPGSCTSDYRRCTYKKQIEIPRGAAAGVWKPTLVCSDVLQNRDVFGSWKLQGMGFVALLHVEDSPQDSAPPVLVSLEIRPELLLTAAAPTVNIRLRVSDGLSPLDGCIAVLHGPSRQSIPLSLNKTGSRCDTEEGKQCTYSFNGEMIPGSEAGQWDLSIACRDSAGNGFAHWADDLAALGFRSSIIVEESLETLIDDGTPILMRFNFSATEIPMDGPREVQVEMSVKDEESQLDGCTVVFVHSSAEVVFAQLIHKNCTNDASECAYRMSAGLPQVPGTWPAAVSCKDAAGNHISHRQNWLEDNGFASHVMIYV